MRRAALIPAILLALVLTALAPSGRSQSTYDYLAKYLVTSGDVELVQRDRLVGFNRVFGADAVRLLDEGEPDEYQTAVALVAIGAAGLQEEIVRLETVVSAGTPLARRAAVLGLGELGTRGGKPLIALTEDPELGDLATFALLRSGHEQGRRLILERFKDADGKSNLLELINFVDGPGNYAEMPPIARLLYRLRFDAARAYGLVDGQRWTVHLAAALSESEEFLDQVVFLTAADSFHPSVPDYILERLLDKGGSAPLLAAMRCMGAEFSALIEAELFVPAGAADWKVIVGEIRRRGPKALDLAILQMAVAEGSHGLEAMILLANLGDTPAAESLRDMLADENAGRRASAARGLGATRDRLWLVELERMQDDPEGRVQAAAMVGRIRVGSNLALAEAKQILSEIEQTEERTTLVFALAEIRHDPVVPSLLRLARENAIGIERMTIDLALRLSGDMQVGRELVEILGLPSGLDERAWIVTALAHEFNREDLAFLGAIFPSERHATINGPTAVALARGSSPVGIELLRKGLWKGPFDRSQLAAAALVRHGGLNILIAELESTPLGASSEALRRVGFALGMFGGLEQLDALRRRRGPADPALQGAYLGALASRTF